MTTPERVWLFHITGISNLPDILQAGGLQSHEAMAASGHKPTTHIAYDHIKARRKTTVVSCAANRTVTQFVPFYFCARSPMLYTVNKGNTGQPSGCQKDIVHLVTDVTTASQCGRPWAFSDVSAACGYPTFYNDLGQLSLLDWNAIHTDRWQGRTNQKGAEFLVADFFDWHHILGIGCMDIAAADRVQTILDGSVVKPKIAVKRNWYY